jgi:hypothetical protein
MPPCHGKAGGFYPCAPSKKKSNTSWYWSIPSHDGWKPSLQLIKGLHSSNNSCHRYHPIVWPPGLHSVRQWAQVCFLYFSKSGTSLKHPVEISHPLSAPILRQVWACQLHTQKFSYHTLSRIPSRLDKTLAHSPSLPLGSPKESTYAQPLRAPLWPSISPYHGSPKAPFSQSSLTFLHSLLWSYTHDQLPKSSDATKVPPVLQVGDLVYLKDTATPGHLTQKWKGPFKVILITPMLQS